MLTLALFFISMLRFFAPADMLRCLLRRLMFDACPSLRVYAAADVTRDITPLPPRDTHRHMP